MTPAPSTSPPSTHPGAAAAEPTPRVIAIAVTSHGFGHAARVCAVIEALQAQRKNLRFEIFSTVPPWFFLDNLDGEITVHPVLVDRGLVQHDALRIDLVRSITELEAFHLSAPARVQQLAARFDALRVDLVIADIAPAALLAAREAKLPSLLIENFTWDWIYRGLAKREPAFLTHASRAQEAFRHAGLRCQVTPFCAPAEEPTPESAQEPADAAPAEHPGPPILQVETVARAARATRAETRAALGIPEAAVALLVTMGGIPWRHPEADSASDHHQPEGTVGSAAAGTSDQTWLILPSDVSAVQTVGRRIYLPHRSRFYHPDLVSAADGVVAKLGYSTLAEAAACGRPLAYVARPDFPESAELEAWARANLLTHRIEPEVFAAGDWYPTLRPWIAQLTDRAADSRVPAQSPVPGSGAEQIASEVLRRLSCRPDAPPPRHPERRSPESSD